ncbi:TRAP transporter substrate-binding protein [Marinobacter sediminicola]|uniref:TRAP transporter substrate-binding protein n=1 Tax=Marinobacter sediminicola TaxID=3072994 RepID=UPI0028114D3F|nr:TRAP transporter substrate-binding protein [Marinobacter sp. F26243]
MKRHTSLKVLVTAVIGFSLPVASSAADIELRAATVGTPGGIQVTGLNALSDHVTEATDGSVNIKLFPSGALGGQVANIESLDSHTLDIVAIETAITTINSDLGILSLPYLFRDRDHVNGALKGEAGEEIRQLLLNDGYRVLGFYEGGFRHITNNRKPIVVPKDLDGLRIRTPASRQRVKMLNAWGGNASPLPYPELYSALQTGVFDGQENPLVEVRASRFYEVQEYLSLTGHVYTTGFLLMNETRFQALPEQLQQALLEGGKKAFESTVAFGTEADEQIVSLVEESGVKVNQVDTAAFVEASQPLWSVFTEKMSSKARDLVKRIAEIP